MSKNLEDFKKIIKENISILISNNELVEAQNLIAEYKKNICDDIEIYSMEAVILIMQNKLDKAELVLKEGLYLDKDNFDLNYNLAYLYLIKESFIKSIEYYKIALKKCNDNNMIDEIEKIINEIIEENNINEIVLKQIDITNEKRKNIKKVLFIQSIPDIRTNKIAKILKLKEIEVDIMYLLLHPNKVYKNMELPYKNIFKLEDINDTIQFINNSDYDILFSCNEPDYISALLTLVNKPLIHDCHDMMSLRGDIANEQIILEYLSNNKCNGNIYVTDLVKEVAIKKFDLKNKPIMLLDNYILKEQLPGKYLRKLSDIDGEIHCVYEGGLSNIEYHHRNIENIFLNLAKNNIHVHFYTAFENIHYRNLEKKSKYLHYEGTKNPNELIVDMTKYDIGLAILNVNERNRGFLDTTFPNKAWEYLASGLPILFSDLLSFRQFIKKHKVGEIINLDNKIKEQVKRVKNIELPNNFLLDNNLLMDDYGNTLVEFMLKIKNTYYK